MSKKNITSLIILFIIFIILLFLFFLRTGLQTKRDNKTKIKAVNINEIYKIEANFIDTNNIQINYLLEKIEGSWYITKPINERAELPTLQHLFSIINNIIPLTVLTNVNNNYGFSNNYIKIFNKSDKLLLYLDIGYKTVDNSSYYVRRNDNKNFIEIISKEIIDDILLPLELYRNRELFDFNYKELQKITLKYPDRKILEIINENEDYYLDLKLTNNKIYRYHPDQNLIKTKLMEVYTIAPELFYPLYLKLKFSSDEPHYIIDCKLNNGSNITLSIYYLNNEKLYIGYMNNREGFIKLMDDFTNFFYFERVFFTN